MAEWRRDIRVPAREEMGTTMNEGFTMEHLDTAQATIDAIKAAATVLEAFPAAAEMVVWGQPPVQIDGKGQRVPQPDMVGRPVAVYDRGEKYLWAATCDMGNGELPHLDMVHDLLRSAGKAMPWIVRVGHSSYWTIRLSEVRKRLDELMPA